MDVDNPYAASEFEELPPVGPAQGNSAALPWNPTEIFGIAWDRFKEHWIVLFLAVLLAEFLGNVPEWLAQFIQMYGGLELHSEVSLAIAYGASFLGWLVDCLMAVGLARMFLQAARGETSPEFGMLFSGFDRVLPMLACLLIAQLAIGLGLVLLIVPGVFFACVFFIADFLVVDQQLGPLRALRTSWGLTKGHRLNIVVLGIFGILASLVGVLACLIGVFAAQALFGVCSALVYLRLIGEQTRGVRVWHSWE
ncbi:MAG: hypothetical protein AB7K71_04080 [Polyangiaceae bacterium]